MTLEHSFGLIWIGKDARAKRKLQTMLENAAKSYCAKHGKTENDVVDDRLIFETVRRESAPLAISETPSRKFAVAGAGHDWQSCRVYPDCCWTHYRSLLPVGRSAARVFAAKNWRCPNI